MITNSLQASDFRVSPALSSIASENKEARLKIIHNEDYTPLAYAIGFGNFHNSSVIVGGVSQDDSISSKVLIRLAGELSHALSKSESLLSINIKNLFSAKGVWIIPDFGSCDKPSTSMNLISEKLSPKRLLEIHSGKQEIRYLSPKNSASNSKLFAYLLSSSSGIETIREAPPENSLCRWFSDEFLKASFSVGIDSEAGDAALFMSMLEAFLIFIAA